MWDYFRTVWNQNFGTALGSLRTDFGLILIHEYCLCVTAKMNNMTGCVKIILLMHAQLMYWHRFLNDVKYIVENIIVHES